jgi:hypothetical protein
VLDPHGLVFHQKVLKKYPINGEKLAKFSLDVIALSFGTEQARQLQEAY